ncbi:MAG: dephospho-CoA kinase [Chloroflexota bacterium]|nr:dephospho-CoA kinase [Chloroflexota bacterium]
MKNPQPAPQHFIIGLTGNIGSGKSLVRKMLEQQGALGIDADWLTREASLRGNPGYAAILARFGDAILGADGAIDRRALGSRVFADKQALADLEDILHPLASLATRNLIARSPLPVVVVEAIKLLESDLAAQCQQIWVVETDVESLYERLARTRGMTSAEVRARLAQQTPAARMKEQAQVVIANNGSVADAWAQVQAAWRALPAQEWNAGAFAKARAQAHLLLADAAGLEEAQASLQANPHSQPAQFLTEQQQQAGSTHDLLRDMLRYNFSAPQAGALAIWRREGLASQVCATQLADASAASLEGLTKGIENLDAYYLSREYSLPAPAAHASTLARLGYDIRNGPGALPETMRKAGYNLYRKSIPDALRLFKDQ